MVLLKQRRALTSGGRRANPVRGAGLGGAAPWQPSDDPNAARWWRADLGRTMVSTKVSAWLDQIEGVSVTQGTDADRPTVGTLDGQEALTFAGSQQLRAAGFTSLATWYAIVVAKVANSGTEVIVDDGDSNTNTWGVFSNATNWGFSAGSTRLGGTSDANAHAFYLARDAGIDAGFVDDWTSAVTIGTLGTNPNESMTVGANHADAGPITGEVAEIIILTSVANIALHGAYITSRYPSITVTT